MSKSEIIGWFRFAEEDQINLQPNTYFKRFKIEKEISELHSHHTRKSAQMYALACCALINRTAANQIQCQVLCPVKRKLYAIEQQCTLAAAAA